MRNRATKLKPSPVVNLWNFAPPFSVEQVGMEAPACFPQPTKTFLHYYGSLESFLKAKWQMMRRPKRSTICTDIYEIRPRANKDGVDLVSDVLPYSPLWYCGPNAIRDAIGYVQFYSRSPDAAIRVYDSGGDLIETHEHAGDLKE